MMLNGHPGGMNLTKRLIAYCGFLPGLRVLDVGCGIGITVEYLLDTCKLHAIGVDISETRVTQGRKRRFSLPMVLASGEQLPFADAWMDGVIAECSISVMNKAEKVLAEVNRILIAGGKLAITDVYARNTAVRDTEGYRSFDEWNNLLRQNGFEIHIWEDHSAVLREFMACLIMEYGSTSPVCEQIIKTARPGYFLLVAEKVKEG